MRETKLRFTAEQWAGLVRLAAAAGYTSVAAYLRARVQALIDARNALTATEREARDRGMADAHMPDKHLQDNPYTPYTSEHAHWTVGFEATRKETSNG